MSSAASAATDEDCLLRAGLIVERDGSVVASPIGSRAVPPALAIAGLTRLSTCDWPGMLVATVFLQGCPLRCTYCHNPELLDTRTPGAIAWSEVVEFLRGRVGLLDGVVFSGGEPLRQDIGGAVNQVKELGFRVGVHTSGMYPRRLAALLPTLDWVGLDLKAHPAEYASVTGVAASGAKAVDALEAVLASGVDLQLRCTWGPGHVEADAVERLTQWLTARGIADLVLQPVRPRP